MGRKSREKQQRKKQLSEEGLNALLSPEAKEEIKQVTGSGDLRLVPTHIEKYLEGNEQAENALRMLGRDASALIIRAAEELDNPELAEFGKGLYAVRPVVETNMMALREVSVAELVEAHREDATALGSANVQVSRTAVAIFDPRRLSVTLARGGKKPLSDDERQAAGDLAWFLLEPDQEAEIELTNAPVPDGQATLARRIKVDSGMVFVGPVEATEGPRFGEVRLDPMRTKLHQHVEAGGFVRLEPGEYELLAYRVGEGHFRVHVGPAGDEALDLSQRVCP